MGLFTSIFTTLRPRKNFADLVRTYPIAFEFDARNSLSCIFKALGVLLFELRLISILAPPVLCEELPYILNFRLVR